MITPVKNVECLGSMTIDMSGNGINEEIARIVVNCNLPRFEIEISFENNGVFIGDNGETVTPTSIIMTREGNGSLGAGLEEPIDIQILPITNGIFIWSPGKQRTATRDYVISIRASWDSQNIIAGYYSETIRATINSEL